MRHSSFREFPKIPSSSIRREIRTPKTSTEPTIVDCGAFSKAKFLGGSSKSWRSEFLEIPFRWNDAVGVHWCSFAVPHLVAAMPR
jgi:hypothetical protein